MLTSHTLKHARNSVSALAAILVALALSPGSVRQASRRQAAMQGVAVGTMAGWGGVGDSRLGAAQVAGAVQVFVEMVEEPAVMAWSRAVKSQSAQSRIQAVAAARTVARAQLSAIQRSQQRVGAALTGGPINGVEIYRVDRVLNGIALIVGADKIEEIRKIPGVKTVHPLELEYADTSTSVPFLGLPQLWNGMPGIGNLTGAGLKIGIVDSGIDYQHANFGGTGKLADYQANDRT